ncbi:hypothetical protein NDU88_006196 [Pleurodeles waltl]|uniref:Uncharacterized protein n=1 Tax=Pleurodeles waltl TaxID=8319 RepID=A0AAV7WFJ7_PLEWA|nr:hypothetical protein NDU88_006196 [Pleurodeles waltl]
MKDPGSEAGGAQPAAAAPREGAERGAIRAAQALSDMRQSPGAQGPPGIRSPPAGLLRRSRRRQRSPPRGASRDLHPPRAGGPPEASLHRPPPGRQSIPVRPRGG